MSQNESPNFEYLQNELLIGSWEKLQGFNEQTLDKTISVFGIGGSGSPMVLTLTRMGFKRIILVDKDVVEKKNLTRQVLYGKKDVGKTKTSAALDNLQAYHSIQSEFEVHQLDITTHTELVEDIIRRSDFVFNLVDNDIALYMVSKAARAFRKPAIYFGTGVVGGMTSCMMFQEPEHGACIPCIFGLPVDFESLSRNFSNKKHGVTASWYPTPALGAAFSAVFMLKSLLNLKVEHNFIITSLYSLEVDKLTMRSKDGCAICGK
jgi:molybdopterin/thiamine biosynthesis adenylyltransferase